MAEPNAAAAPKKKRGGCCGFGSGDPKYGMLPDDKRKCRDVLGCLLFLAFWVGMIVIGAIGISMGKWQRLVYGTDYQGNVCGSEVPGKKYVVYPRGNEDFLANFGKNPTQFTFYGICVSSCPSAMSTVCNYDTQQQPFSLVPANWTAACLNDPYGATYPNNFVIPGPSAPFGITCGAVRGGCWTIPQDTSSTLFRCIPSYNVSNYAKSVCIYPTTITNPYDPACVIVQTNTAGVVQKPARPNQLFEQLATARQVWGRWFGDLARAWWVILVCAVAFALAVGFVFVNFLKYCTGCMVWTVVTLSVVLMGFLTGYFYYKAGLVDSSILPTSLTSALSQLPGVTTVSNAVNTAGASISYVVPSEFTQDASLSQQSYSYLAYIFTALTIIIFAIVLAARSAIRTAVEVIKLGAEALRATPALIMFPFTNVLAIGVFLVWWVFVAACLASAGNKVTIADVYQQASAGAVAYTKDFGLPLNSTFSILSSPSINATYTSIADSPAMGYLLIYYFFGLLWTIQFIHGVASLAIAGSVGGWYFAQLPKEAAGDPELEKLKYDRGRTPVCSALWRAIRYHMGSVAIGSLLIALMQFIRAIVAYMSHKLEKTAKNSNTVKFVLCCVNCCLKCMQTCVEIITRNAYIYVAIKGEGFLRAGRRVFGLIVTHGKVFMLTSVLGEMLMFLGKVLIAVASAFLAYIILNSSAQFQPGGSQQLTSTWLPVLVTLFFAYAVAAGFMAVFDLSVDTVLVCYVTDIDENLARHGGDPRHAVPIHVSRDKLDVKGKMEYVKKQREVEEENARRASAARAGAGKGAPEPIPTAPSGPVVGGSVAV